VGSSDRVRIGILGAARIAPQAVVKPARRVSGVEAAAVAARDPERARKFATKHGIPTVHDSYDALLADDSIDAVYNPLPNGLHAHWTERALAAGKHVLCEKPFTANAEEAEAVAKSAASSGLVVMEAFHYRYHPVAQRMLDFVRSGELGAIAHIDSAMCIPLPLPGDIRYQYALAGGAVMDVGCYALHMNRLLAGEEPEVVSARVKLARPNVDRWAQAELRYPSGTTGTMSCALLSARVLSIRIQVRGERGTLRVFNPTGPQFGYRMSVRSHDGRQRVRVEGARTPTYAYQLEAFRDAVTSGAPVLTPPSDSVANMRAVDAVYQAAGLPVRGT
jgi:predicted dehydrogenase